MNRIYGVSEKRRVNKVLGGRSMVIGQEPLVRLSHPQDR
jgi:hypothetical protein